MGSYVVRGRVMVEGSLRALDMERASSMLLCGFLRGVADAVEGGQGELASLSVERSGEPPRRL